MVVLSINFFVVVNSSFSRDLLVSKCLEGRGCDLSYLFLSVLHRSS